MPKQGLDWGWSTEVIQNTAPENGEPKEALLKVRKHLVLGIQHVLYNYQKTLMKCIKPLLFVKG